jgi:hypothetical protein
VVVARGSRGRERFGVAAGVSWVPMVAWACCRRGRWDVVVVPYIVTDGLVRRREVVGFDCVVAEFAIFVSEAMWLLLLVGLRG